MNWLHFLLWIAGIYGVYYTVIIVLDLTKGKRSPAVKSGVHELTFSEVQQPQKLEHNSGNDLKSNAVSTAKGKKAYQNPEVMGSGGVSIHELFTLARQDAIAYTKSVSF
jgi:hypothetical protein